MSLRILRRWEYLALNLLILAVPFCSSIWIGEEYWTQIHYNGEIERPRSVADFLPFGVDNAFIAYWISLDKRDSEDGHYEAFGHAFLKSSGSGTSPQVCATFIDIKRRRRELCGGFRVLSRSKASNSANPFTFVNSAIANPDRAVDYLDVHVSRIKTEDGQIIFGGANIQERAAYGVNPNVDPVLISFATDRAAYVQRVEILEVQNGSPLPNLPVPAPVRPQSPPARRETSKSTPKPIVILEPSTVRLAEITELLTPEELVFSLVPDTTLTTTVEESTLSPSTSQPVFAPIVDRPEDSESPPQLVWRRTAPPEPIRVQALSTTTDPSGVILPMPEDEEPNDFFAQENTKERLRKLMIRRQRRRQLQKLRLMKKFKRSGNKNHLS
ncbi:Prion-like-(Q/N-rich)-domain-bearing protein [Ditylenchus destructor]|nr:Prion-like-(Q/N-rich)-domain-bearing protein [Ditylenchus destructor]